MKTPRRYLLRARPARATSLIILAALAPISFSAQNAAADALADIQSRGELIWGADQEGGGPYVFADPSDPDTLTGFEVDLADLLAKHLSVNAKFSQKNWDTLPQFLDAGEIDIILNGYELTPQRAAKMEATRPYYIYELQLLTKKGNTQIQSWDDLLRPPAGRRYSIGVLEPSGASAYVRQRFGEAVNLVSYDGNTNAMMQVATGANDATVQDLPIAIFYSDKPQGSGLQFIGEPVGRGYYVMYARKGETALATALNDAIGASLKDGSLKAIYEKYGIWNATQDALASETPHVDAAEQEHGWQVIEKYAPTLIRAAGITVFLSITAMPLAIIIGLLAAIGRMYGPRWLSMILGLYVEVLRGTPLMLQLFFLYFLLPRVLPFTFSPIVAAIIGLAVNYSAYEAEIYRAGLQAIPKGQMDAALALGMTRRTALRRVIVPQAVKIVIPPVTNDFIALFKDTSVCSAISVIELTKQYNILGNGTGAIVELAVLTGLLYMIMSYPLAIVARRMEKTLAKSGKAAVH